MAAFSEIGKLHKKGPSLCDGLSSWGSNDFWDGSRGCHCMLLASDDLFFHVWNDCGPSPSKTFCGWFSLIVLEMEVLSPLHWRLKFAELC